MEKAAKEIQATKLPAYFVPRGTLDPVEAKTFYAVIARNDTFVKHYEASWNRLVQQDYITLLLHESWEANIELPNEEVKVGEAEDAKQWPKRLRAQVLSRPATIPDLADHVNEDKYPNDLILAMRSSYREGFRVFGGCGAAQSSLEVSFSQPVLNTLAEFNQPPLQKSETH